VEDGTVDLAFGGTVRLAEQARRIDRRNVDKNLVAQPDPRGLLLVPGERSLVARSRDDVFAGSGGMIIHALPS
jgi:hypothetical protein